jgi:group I intron endonuclease
LVWLAAFGFSNFILEILEYCEPQEAIKREQYYLNFLKPEYNILKIAGSTLGFKHSEKTLSKFKERKFSEEHIGKLREHLTRLHVMNMRKEIRAKISAGMANFNVSTKGIVIKVTNLETNVSVEYASIRETARALNSNKTTLTKYLQNSKPFLGIYRLETKFTVSKKENSNRKIHPAAIKIEVTDLELNTKTTYDSMTAAGIALNIQTTTIANYFKRNQIAPFKGRYTFQKV